MPYCSLTKGTSMTPRRSWMRGSGSALAALAALVTTLCCLGFPALVGFLSALGAGFLLSDRYLEPLLAGTLLLSLVAAGTVFFAIYGIGLLPHASGGDHMADGMAATPTWSPFLAYGAILVLLGAQIWDLWLYRRCAPKAAPVPTHSRSALLERRKEGA